jgi:hypothetical protein
MVGFNGNNHLEAFYRSGSLSAHRHLPVQKYSFAVPDIRALEAILRFSNRRIIEIGSGTGYWAKLLQDAGADIIAVDVGTWLPPAHFPETILEDGAAYLERNDGCADRTLFLCWPLTCSDFTGAFLGETVVWIGEVDGCTGEIDEGEWEVVETVEIPNWACIHDVLKLYRRREKSEGTEDLGHQD